MFGHHHHHHHRGERRFARGFFGRGDHHEHRGHRGGGRFFDHGELRLLVLHLISEKPRHGYEIIKAIEERLAGAYSPSPGTIYPTLTLLEELGQVSVTEQGGKKLHTITPEGTRALEEAAPQVASIEARIAAAGGDRPQASAMQVMRAMHNLKTALRFRMMRGGMTEEELGRIVAAIDEAARQVERA
ncbi:PadR family transcriptional regulator [Rhodovarius crocodyli]|uniref:PadR family transcriptional regulator n=1 Tax=Rhodovarius crocodyli TaxID=1979269 RepID=A0A437MG50_9PROT|nr:PadR family transcriptional regulator [Rhodovarius crocodyli]RVT96638.1 PadR family transcriptional regulator [Rhodovarius crocodyli]